MELVVCKSTQQMNLLTVQWLESHLLQDQIQSIFLPAGNTPKDLYAWMEAQGASRFKGLRFLQIDEILTGPKAYEFRKFFLQALPSLSAQMEWITPSLGRGDAAILGFGKNGHVAFHEPGISHPFWGGKVELTPETCAALSVMPPIEALTYGAESFLHTKACLLLVSGSGKAIAFQKFLAQDPSIPASRLHQHTALTVLVTKEIYDGSGQ